MLPCGHSWGWGGGHIQAKRIEGFSFHLIKFNDGQVSLYYKGLIQCYFIHQSDIRISLISGVLREAGCGVGVGGSVGLLVGGGRKGCKNQQPFRSPNPQDWRLEVPTRSPAVGAGVRACCAPAVEPPSRSWSKRRRRGGSCCPGAKALSCGRDSAAARTRPPSWT